MNFNNKVVLSNRWQVRDVVDRTLMADVDAAVAVSLLLSVVTTIIFSNSDDVVSFVTVNPLIVFSFVARSLAMVMVSGAAPLVPPVV